MAYRFKRKESVAEGIRRIAVEQAQQAAQGLAGESPDIDEGIHDARKSLKKCRSLLRLVRDDLGDKHYRAENRWFREAKNQLSSARDAEAMIETFDKLAERYPAVGGCQLLASLHDGLVERRERIAQQEQDIQEIAGITAQLLGEVKPRSRNWDLAHSGFGALEHGLARIYRQGQKAMDEAYRQPSDESFHEWRKRVKDHWYHCRLLHNIWPEAMQSRESELKRLSDLLGDDHDLGVLGHVLSEDSQNLQGDADTLLCLAQRRQGELRAEALPLGERLYGEEPNCLTGELRSYWRAWRS